MTKYQVLARRYRPQKFRDVVGQESIVTTLKNALRMDRTAHAYLFSGSRGVGKTTLARLFAKALNCASKGEDLEPCNKCPSCLEIGTGQSLDVIEIDGASNRGIDDVRSIAETACYSPSFGRYKIYIIDEVHMLTKEAFNALLKTLEEPPEKAKFLFATTEPHKVLPTIISRCQRFDLGRLQTSQIVQKLEQIAKDLQRPVELDAIHLIASFSEGSLRDAESLFDQILCFAEGTVTLEAVRSSLGLIPQEEFFALDQAFAQADSKFAFTLVNSLFLAGKDLSHFFGQLIEHVRLLTLAKASGQNALSLPAELASKYMTSSQLYTPSQCLHLLEYLLRIESQLHQSSSQRIALEGALLHYIQSKNRIPVEILIRRLAELEQKAGLEGNGIAPSEPIVAESVFKTEQARDKPPVSPSMPEKLPLSAVEKKPPAAPTPEVLPEKQPALETTLPLIEKKSLTPPMPEKLSPSPAEKKPPSAPIPEVLPEKQPALEATPPPIEKKSLAPPMPEELPLSPVEKKPSSAPTPEVLPEKQPALEATPPPIEKKSLAPPPSQLKNPSPEEKQNQASYDTLMRFAAVELEGTLKIKAGG